MSFLYRLGTFLINHARRQGKTFNLVQLCKKTEASLIVRDQKEADRLKEEFKIKAFPYSKEFSGHQGIVYVDPDAVGQIILELEEKQKILVDALKTVVRTYVEERDIGIASEAL